MASRRWRETTVGALCDEGALHTQTGPFGSQLHSYDYVPSGIPVVPTEGIGRRRLLTDGIPEVSEKIASRLSRHKLRAGDILFARRGVQATGLSAIVTQLQEGWICGTGTLLLRITSTEIDAEFLSFLFSSDESFEWLRQHAVGAVMPNLNDGVIRRLPLTLPPLAEQKAIAAVLGALDDKIELNLRMNATLEAMARALFSNWVRTCGDEIEEHLVQQMIDERVLLIGDCYRAKNSEFANDGLPFIRAGNLKGDGFDLAEAEVLSASSVAAAGHKVGMVGDVAFTSKGTVGRITRVSSRTGEFVYSPQVCFWRSLIPHRLHPNVLYRWMSTDAFMRQVAVVSTQTDMAPYVSLQDQRRMVIQLPPPSAQREIANQLETVDDKIATNAHQSRTLAALRDALLPKLLSGELSFRQAVDAAGAVA